ncbi:hypothetical protein JCM8097_002044 [Rhodosporidiobolus ruineniae]
MPSTALASARRRLTALLPLVVAVVCLGVLLSAQQGADYSESTLVPSSDAVHVPSTGPSLAVEAASDVPLTKSDDSNYIRKQRIGLAGNDRQQVITTDTQADLAFTVQHPPHSAPHLPLAPAPSSLPPSTKSRLWALFCHATDRAVTRIGDTVLALFGFDDQDWFGLGELEEELNADGLEGGAAGALAGWSESTVFVERTASLLPSRPSSFGPHLVSDPLRGLLLPITALSPSTDSYACTIPTSSSSSPDEAGEEKPDKLGWIALVQRGDCPFSDKVRTAQALGAKAVVFGDMEESVGGIGGGKGLLTPWSPDDTSDISIPSTFVSRVSYLTLLHLWEEEQTLVHGEKPEMEDGETQTELAREKKPVGLEVVLSKEEMFAWPLLDLLFLLLFLPSLLTLVTVFTQRVRLARAQKAERAPKDAVARLPVFRWGDCEKGAECAGHEGGEGEGDEEQRVGGNVGASEETPLLDHHHDEERAPLSLLQRAAAYLPSPLSRRFGPSSPPAPLHRPLSRPSHRYPSLVECPFCLSDFERGDLVMELPACGHVFHADEITPWLEQQKALCPICRTSVLDPSTPTASAEAAEEAVRGQANPAPVVDGAAVLVPPPLSPAVAAQPLGYGGTTPTAAAELEFDRQHAAASPVASSSSVPIEGLLARAGEVGATEEERKEGEARKE